ncbi:MAG: HlyD family efflux transporter periplasmic adaptor subunit, partial [Shimia sp.]
LLDAQEAAEAALMELAQRRVDRLEALRAKGLSTAQEAEIAEQGALAAERGQLSLAARRLAGEARIADADRRLALLHGERQGELARRKVAHLRELIDTRMRIERLERRIAEAEIRAPVAGRISELGVEAAQSVVAPGGVVAVVTQPVRRHEIALTVPASYIDQVRPGQEGQLTVPGLSQRTAPRLGVRITAIADEPVRDQDGQTLHYLARAEFDAGDLRQARLDLGADFTLTPGMPVNAALEGHTTTLWSFLVGPIGSILSRAFQD